MRPIRYGDIRQVLTSVADTTVTLASPTKRHYLIGGSAALYWLVLPDARTLPAGAVFFFENISSEFVGVRNSSSATWHRVPPRAGLMCVLQTNTTAAGVWYSHVDGHHNPSYGLSYFDDMNGYSAGVVSSGLVGVVSGAGAIVSTSYTGIANSISGRQGNLICFTGTTISGYALAYYSACLNYLGSGCRAFEVSQNLSNISTAADEYIARFGIGDNVAGGAHTEGAYFLYDRYNGGGAVQTNWMLKTVKTAGGAGSTVVDSGVAPIYDTTSSTWQKLRLEVSSAANRVDFWINNVQVSAAGGITTNIPATTSPLRIGHIGITKTEDAGVNARYSRTDYMWIQSYPTTPR